MMSTYFIQIKKITLAALLMVGVSASMGVSAQTSQSNQSLPDAQSAPATVLSIVQVCTSMARRANCQLVFVPTQSAQTPVGNIQSSCAPGWLAYLSVEQGTVEQGGVNRGEAVVCGHASADAALKAVMRACNEQNLGMCDRANQIDAKWALWPEKSVLLANLPLNQPVDLRAFEQFQACQTKVPVTESASCSNRAAKASRLSGFK